MITVEQIEDTLCGIYQEIEDVKKDGNMKPSFVNFLVKIKKQHIAELKRISRKINQVIYDKK